MLCKPPPLVPEHFHNDVILEEKNESQVDRTLALVGHLTGRSFIQGGGWTLGCLLRGTPPPPGHGSGWDDFLDCMSGAVSLQCLQPAYHPTSRAAQKEFASSVTASHISFKGCCTYWVITIALPSWIAINNLKMKRAVKATDIFMNLKPQIQAKGVLLNWKKAVKIQLIQKKK